MSSILKLVLAVFFEKLIEYIFILLKDYLRQQKSLKKQKQIIDKAVHKLEQAGHDAKKKEAALDNIITTYKL